MQNAVGKIALSVVTALAGGTAWLVAKPGAETLLNNFKTTKTAEAALVSNPTPGEAATAVAAPDVSLASSLSGLAEIAKAANRPDTAIVALTAAGVKMGELNNKIAALGPGDGAARDLLTSNIDEVALTAARNEVTALAADADKLAASIDNDFKGAEAELTSSGKKLDTDSIKAAGDAVAAYAVITSAVETAKGADVAAVLGAVSSAETSMVTLTSLRPAASAAYTKAKRNTFNNGLAGARAASQEITALAAGKKSGVFDSKDKKADIKYLTDTDAWAKARLALLDQGAAKLATADRKTLTQYAADAAKTRTELEAALVEVKAAAARVPSK
jgi:hypothetical protein